MSNFSDFDQVVVSMMQDFGCIAQLLIQDDSSAVYDPATGALSGAIVTPYNVNAIFMDYTLNRYGLQDQQGTLITTGDKQCWVQPINKANPLLTMPMIQPNKDRIAVAGKVYKIANLKMINPTFGDNIVYELHLKE